MWNRKETSNNGELGGYYDKDFGDGIVVESEGSNYARYAQYVPQAKTIYDHYRATHLNELRLCCTIEIYQHIEDYPRDNCILDNADIAGNADKTDCFHNRSHHTLFYFTILRLHRIWD